MTIWVVICGLCVHVCVTQDGCRTVVDALTSNTTLLQLDLRMTGCTPELMHCAHTLLMRNRQQANVDVSCDTESAPTQPPC